MVRKKSKQNNPEQKTRNGINNQEVEFGSANVIPRSKKKYEETGGQPVKSKFHPE
ncbi:glycogen biosynthesis protein GlgD [Cytobacillus sp. FSL W7-1323]|uniref:Glycogen biosynthesis protein GlgD n=1 Tax=Cytobacillus kochii TaxID=859143 RepID=A0A248TK67_9BACI|nr:MULTISPECIES: glycogen biosynthesis protein GlgD [Cytobacillus]ASV68603.1 glycogen biosynthesis protein GlgD [Cytobacillus kochii]MCA1028768.1 glycogen biosynthesis protein GlgD [Cytobacillus kochii]MCM3322966.1 glycogen biosynthesis protein GlgD [Cytobacillus kochii]MCM3345362.1 glycogen biosynthesis protein GlgD [Cytobacillus kochii]MDM5208900.1 glycogen biosynthesis protein GlgD [Cytobacillus kochii]